MQILLLDTPIRHLEINFFYYLLKLVSRFKSIVSKYNYYNKYKYNYII